MKGMIYQYDETIRPGDIITSYKAGFYRVLKVTKRYYTKEMEPSFDYLEREFGVRPKVGDEMNPIIDSERLLTSTFKVRKGADSCDAAFCKKISPEIRSKVMDTLDWDIA
jgi:hypothetical protein